MRDLHTLRFEPILKERVWGGRRLAGLGKRLPGPAPFGESWELCDLPSDQSVVAEGALRGVSLGELRAERAGELLGPCRLDGGSFPMLVKYIDAAETLSVQVHPPAEVAARLGGRPKSEAWYVLDAQPGAALYVGFREGCGRREYEAALAAGRVEEILRALPVHAGQLVPVAPGTVHAIGAGVLLAEVQQPSDTTYRVYDWGRVGLDGKPRPLHQGEALESLRFEERPAVLEGAVEVDLQLFRIRVVELAAGGALPLDGVGPLVLVGCDGEAQVEAAGGEAMSCARGTVLLVPHACRRGQARTSSTARLLAVSFSG
jgi:mannose-6-phosphate isomerase